MNSKSALPPMTQPPQLAAGIRARIIQILTGYLVVGAILFLAAGSLDWLWAWVYLGIMLALIGVNAVVMHRLNPEVIAERGRPGAMQDWDKIISLLWSIAQYLALPLIAGLDRRFGWSAGIDVGCHWAGVFLFICGMALSSWAMAVNRYFSTVVRIQRERGQTVCRSGPYRYVRHPGYTGFIIQALGLPLLLGSWWACIPAYVSANLIIIRTIFEDRLLQAELSGYQDYVREVRFRLVPDLW